MNSPQAPKHIAIIMDGNGRWAQKQKLLRIQGHRQGVRVVRKIVEACQERGLEYLTLYAFSSENWARPSREVQFLMRLLKIYSIRERIHLKKNNIRFRVIGEVERIPELARLELEKTIEETATCTGMCLQLALSYGGRNEILRAVRDVMKSGLSPNELDEAKFEEFLDTRGQIPPDLIIRTSGEQRLSNFLIWQSAYSEFYFTDCLWPDFDEAELDRAIEAYIQRDRRYGKVLEGD